MKLQMLFLVAGAAVAAQAVELSAWRGGFRAINDTVLTMQSVVGFD